MRNNSQDLVFSNFVIHYLTDLEKCFGEVSRILKHEAYFVFTFNIFETENSGLFNTEIPLVLGDEVIVVNLIKRREEVRDALSANGFEVEIYEKLDSSYLAVDESYQYKDEIDDIVNILCIAKKT